MALKLTTENWQNSLLRAVRKIENDFNKEINLNTKSVMASSSSWAIYYNEEIMYYTQGAKLCKDYYEGKDLLKLLEGLLDNEFFKQMISLKKFVPEDQTDALELIRLAECSIENFGEYSKNGIDNSDEDSD